MSTIYEKVYSYFFSSDPLSGANARSADGSSFSVNLINPINIGKVIDCNLDVIQATVEYTFPNIKASFNNNTLNFTVGVTPYIITIPTGLYSLRGLNSFFRNFFLNNALPANLFILSGNEATQTVTITFNLAGVQLDFTTLTSVRTILGFNSGTYPVAPSILNENVTGQNPAQFNLITGLFVRSTLTMGGLPINGVNNGIIAQIPLSASPGSQIVYQPQNVINVDCSNLINQSIQKIQFELLDQLFRPVDTNGEYYSLIVHIHTKILLSSEPLPLIPG